MAASPLFKNTLLYEAAMIALYGRHYAARYRAIAALIPAGATVLDVCCGPAVLYTRYLLKKQVRYTGLDVSRPFIDRLNRAGGCGELRDVAKGAPLPRAEYVVMQGSLMHFLPDARAMIERMMSAAQRQVIVAEPIRNIGSSKTPLVAAIARRFTDPGDGSATLRFDEERLDALFAPYSASVASAFCVPGGREKVYVLNATSLHPSAGEPLAGAGTVRP